MNEFGNNSVKKRSLLVSDIFPASKKSAVIGTERIQNNNKGTMRLGFVTPKGASRAS